MEKIPPGFFRARLDKTRAFAGENGFDALCLLNLQNIYWISGTAQFGVLVVFPEDDPVLLVRRNFERALEETVLEDVRETRKTTDVVGVLTEKLSGVDGKKVGIELGFIPATLFQKYQSMLAGAELADVGGVMRRLRMVKDEHEIARHELGGAVAQKTQEALQEALVLGVREVDLAAEMVYACKKNSGEHFSIYYARWFANNWFIVASGKNLWTPSSFPIMAGGGFDPAIPYGSTERVLRDGDMVVADYAFPILGYHADHARTYVLGELPAKFRERYEVLMNAYECGLDYLRPGETAESVFLAMKGELAKHKLDKYFCGDGKYYQAVGHGIGLELDEPPFLMRGDETRFEEGMVISVEPKIIIPGWGAVNFEDNFVVSGKGRARKLTNTPYLEF
ncbi:MAG: M24 family metallopeptidase [Promethearchaeota archaeon]